MGAIVGTGQAGAQPELAYCCPYYDYTLTTTH